MKSDIEEAVQYLKQAIALRKIASEMESYDQKSANNLTQLANEYEEKAARVTEALGTSG